ncbi:MAG: glycosyltransferase family 39 protein [Fibromonadaceae bacterium]|nr:glycosyltransferase family 39 protein [Fibromonadaceae bacterium]
MIPIFKKIAKDEKLLLKITLGISAIWVLAQIVLVVCFWGYPHTKGDAGNYISMALRCFNNGQWYPMVEDVYPTTWLCAQGIINLLILQLRIFGTTDLNVVLNLFLNIAILLEIYYLGKKFFSKRTGLISVIIFCLFYSNLFIILEPLTELPFLFLCLSALCLVFSGKWRYVIVAALLFAIANWFRPLAIIFLFVSALYFFITKAKFYNYIALVIPYILVLFIIGTMTENKIGHFVYQSTTFGYNLLMASHDDAKGNINHYTFHEGGAGFIENQDSLTFAERESIWRNRAFEWIKEHPIKFSVLFFKKIPTLYVHDAWPFSGYWWDEGIFVKKILFQSLISIPYYLAFLLFFYALWINRKKLFSAKAVFPVIFITGTIITCIFPVGMRYHYPFMFTVIIYAAWGLDSYLESEVAAVSRSF